MDIYELSSLPDGANAEPPVRGKPYRLTPRDAMLGEVRDPLDLSEAERLLRTTDVQVDPAAAGQLALYPRGGTVDRLARLLGDGRLDLLEDTIGDEMFMGGGSGKAPPPAPPPESAPPPVEEKLAWIEVVLVNEDGKGMTGEPYKIVLPDGATRAGKLGDGGKVKLEDIPAGTCWVQFPNLGMARAEETSSS